MTSDAVVVLVTTAGISAGAITSLSPDLKLLRAYLTGMLGPTIVVAARMSSESRVALGLSVLVLMYLGFLCVEGKHLHDAFVLAMVRTHALGEAAAAMNERNGSMKLVLDTVGQGFLRVDLDGRMADERSAALTTWLGESEPGEPVWAFVGRRNAKVGLALEVGWDALAEDFLPLELTLEQLPGRIECDGRILDLTYRPIEPGSAKRGLLLVFDGRDRTGGERARERRAERAPERVRAHS